MLDTGILPAFSPYFLMRRHCKINLVLYCSVLLAGRDESDRQGGADTGGSGSGSRVHPAARTAATAIGSAAGTVLGAVAGPAGAAAGAAIGGGVGRGIADALAGDREQAEVYDQVG